MRLSLIVTIAFCLFTLGCHEDDLAKDAPKCLIDLVKERFEDCKDCKDASIREYQFQNSLVYVLDDGLNHPDHAVSVYDDQCNYLGILGGIAGFTEINGEEFEHAIFVRTVWQKN